MIDRLSKTPDKAPAEANSGPVNVLVSAARTLADSDSPVAVLDAMLASFVTCLGAEAAAILLLDDGQMTCPVRCGPISVAADNPALGPMIEALEADSLEHHGETALVRHIENDWGLCVRSMIWAPITAGGERLGAIVVLNKGHSQNFGPSDADFLETVSCSLALAMTNAQLRKARAEMDVTTQELELAAAIQRDLLPKFDPSKSPVQGFNRPIRKVSGDFFDYLFRGDGQISFALGDVSGKGINAALLMSKTASLFRCLAKTIDDPAQLLTALNGEVCETATRGMFVTMVAGVYDPISGRIDFANAGHEPPLLRLPNRTYRMFPADAPPLGIVEHFGLETTSINSGGGEFYIFSDGLTEFRYSKNEVLGVEGLIQLLEVFTDTSLAQRVQAVLDELSSDGWEAKDDLTVLTIDGAWVRHDA